MIRSRKILCRCRPQLAFYHLSCTLRPLGIGVMTERIPIPPLNAAPLFQDRLLPSSSTIFNLNISFEPFYRVILVYSNWTDDKDVALRVSQAVPIVKFKNALQIVRNAKSYGNAIIVTVTKYDAISYVKSLELKGLEGIMEEA